MFARFWYFVVATVAGVALALAFLAHAAFAREARGNVDDHIRRDRFEVELWLRLDAQARLDAIRPMTVNTDITSAARPAAFWADFAGLRRDAASAASRRSSTFSNLSPRSIASSRAFWSTFRKSG